MLLILLLLTFEYDIFCCNIADFDCGNGRCIPSAWVCDGLRDCVDGSDERHSLCGTRTANSTCAGNELECDRGGCRVCVLVRWICDGLNDCDDGEDEKYCATRKAFGDCGLAQFSCLSGGCVSRALLCNGVFDCMDGSDESLDHCPTAGKIKVTTKASKISEQSLQNIATTETSMTFSAAENTKTHPTTPKPSLAVEHFEKVLPIVPRPKLEKFVPHTTRISPVILTTNPPVHIKSIFISRQISTPFPTTQPTTTTSSKEILTASNISLAAIVPVLFLSNQSRQIPMERIHHIIQIQPSMTSTTIQPVKITSRKPFLSITSKRKNLDYDVIHEIPIQDLKNLESKEDNRIKKISESSQRKETQPPALLIETSTPSQKNCSKSPKVPVRFYKGIPIDPINQRRNSSSKSMP